MCVLNMTFFYTIESVTTDLNVMKWACVMGRASQKRYSWI
jgi:hypothetical protein